MKDYTLFSYQELFCDNFAKLSDTAKLYYIRLNFLANKGFVADPLQQLDLMNYDHDILTELINNGDLLKLPNRDEVFITKYFCHNPSFDKKEWAKSTFAIYWKGKLWFKENGVATFKQQKQEIENNYNLDDKF